MGRIPAPMTPTPHMTKSNRYDPRAINPDYWPPAERSHYGALAVLVLVLFLFIAAIRGWAQDNTNPDCGPGNVVQNVDGPLDGPAAKPTRCLFTQISSTPSSNYPKFVGPTDSLPLALATALPGDMIVVDPANTTIVTTKLQFPSGDCASQKYITVKTSSSLIPDEFTRVGPTFAQFMPKLFMSGQNASIVLGSCLRLIGLEVSRTSGTGLVYNLIVPPTTGSHDFILDRLYVHGTATDETNRGLQTSGTYNAAVINSYFSDFHCLAAVGSCTDSQAIHGGLSKSPDGNIKLVNNYLESSGEGVLFGGGGATETPTDITVMYNTFIKQKCWNPSDPCYAPVLGKDGKPHPWIVKNHFELKNAARVRFEGNRLQNVWGGFTQKGFAILLTAKNQGGANGTSVCPACAVTDVIVRFNYTSYAGAAIQAACVSNENGGVPAACGRYSIHDNLTDSLQYFYCYQCQSFLGQISGNITGIPPFGYVTMSNNTLLLEGTYLTPATSGAATQANGVLFLGGPLTGMPGMHFDHNSFDAGNNGVYSTGGGPTNCWSGSGSIKALVTKCWPDGSFTANSIAVTLPFNKSKLPWPDGNIINTSGTTTGANLTAINSAVSKAH